jgi:hypothetical protein
MIIQGQNSMNALKNQIQNLISEDGALNARLQATNPF